MKTRFTCWSGIRSWEFFLCTMDFVACSRLGEAETVAAKQAVEDDQIGDSQHKARMTFVFGSFCALG